jgi:ATP-dependent Clp protease protease subunit
MINMRNNKDAEKYLKSQTNIKSQYLDHYKARVNSSMLYEGSNNVDVFSKLFDARILTLSGEVDDYICELLKAQLLYLETISSDDITLYICSGGGSVYAGLGLLDVMDLVKPDIITVNTGLAASMAAVILCSGTKGKRKALKRSRTMIHQPMSGFSDYSQASDMEIEVKEVNSLKKELYEIISDSSGQPYDKIHKDSDRDYWMNSIEAKKYGLIDEVIKRNGR